MGFWRVFFQVVFGLVIHKEMRFGADVPAGVYANRADRLLVNKPLGVALLPADFGQLIIWGAYLAPRSLPFRKVIISEGNYYKLIVAFRNWEAYYCLKIGKLIALKN